MLNQTPRGLSGSMKNLSKILPSTAHNRLLELNNMLVNQGHPGYNISGSISNIHLMSNMDLAMCNCDELTTDPSAFYSLEKRPFRIPYQRNKSVINNNIENINQNTSGSLFSMKRSASVPGRQENSLNQIPSPTGIQMVNVTQSNRYFLSPQVQANDIHRSQMNLSLHGYVPPYQHHSYEKNTNYRSKSWGERLNKVAIVNQQNHQQQRQNMNILNVNTNMNYNRVNSPPTFQSYNSNNAFDQSGRMVRITGNQNVKNGYLDKDQFQIGSNTTTKTGIRMKKKDHHSEDISLSSLFRKKFHETNFNGNENIRPKSSTKTSSHEMNGKMRRSQNPFTVSNSWQPMRMEIGSNRNPNLSSLPNETNIGTEMMVMQNHQFNNTSTTSFKNAQRLLESTSGQQQIAPMLPARLNNQPNYANTNQILSPSNNNDYPLSPNNDTRCTFNNTVHYNRGSNSNESMTSIVEALQRATDTIIQAKERRRNISIVHDQNSADQSSEEEEEIEYKIIPKFSDRKRGINMTEEIKKIENIQPKTTTQDYSENITIINRKGNEKNDSQVGVNQNLTRDEIETRRGIRSGSITVEDVYDSPPVMSFIEDNNSQQQPNSPGILETHFPDQDFPEIPAHRSIRRGVNLTRNHVLLEESESGLARFTMDKKRVNLPLKDYDIKFADNFTQSTPTLQRDQTAEVKLVQSFIDRRKRNTPDNSKMTPDEYSNSSTYQQADEVITTGNKHQPDSNSSTYQQTILGGKQQLTSTISAGLPTRLENYAEKAFDGVGDYSQSTTGTTPSAMFKNKLHSNFESSTNF